MTQQLEYVPQSMTDPRAIFCTGKEFVQGFVQSLQSSRHNMPETEIPSDGRELAKKKESGD